MFAESFFDEMEKIAVGSGGTPALLGTAYEPREVQKRIDPVRQMTHDLFDKRQRYAPAKPGTRSTTILPQRSGVNLRRQIGIEKAIAPVRSSKLPPGHMNFR